METSLMVNDYPMKPEEDETEITIHLKVKTTDIFPETWEKEDIESYVKGNIRDYLIDGEIEIEEVEV